MRYESHFIGASITAVTVPVVAKYSGISLNINDLILIIPAIILGGIFPDCDIKSKAQKYYGIGILILSAFLMYKGMTEYALIPTIPFLLAVTSRHRSWTHSLLLPLFLIVIPILTFFTFTDVTAVRYIFIKYYHVIVSFAIGVTVHILLDWKKLKKLARFIGGEKLVKILYG